MRNLQTDKRSNRRMEGLVACFAQSLRMGAPAPQTSRIALQERGSSRHQHIAVSSAGTNRSGADSISLALYLPTDSQFLHLPLESGAFEAESCSGAIRAANDPSSLGEDFQYVIAFGFLERGRDIRSRGFR